MKIFAFKNTTDEKPIFVYDAYCLRKTGEQQIFYDFRGREMIVVKGEKNYYFRYKSYTEEYKRISKGVVHDIFQAILCKRKFLRYYKINNDKTREFVEVSLREYPEDEYPIRNIMDQHSILKIDIMCFPEPDIFNITEKSKGLGIEVTVTHKCTEDKIYTFHQDQNNEYLELIVPKRWKRVNNFSITPKYFYKLYRNISNYIDNDLILRKFREPQEARDKLLKSVEEIGAL